MFKKFYNWLRGLFVYTSTPEVKQVRMSEWHDTKYSDLYMAAYEAIMGRKVYQPLLVENFHNLHTNFGHHEPCNSGVRIEFNEAGLGRMKVGPEYDWGAINIAVAYLPVAAKVDPKMWKYMRLNYSKTPFNIPSLGTVTPNTPIGEDNGNNREECQGQQDCPEEREG
jgi:hypothetical protein